MSVVAEHYGREQRAPQRLDRALPSAVYRLQMAVAAVVEQGISIDVMHGSSGSM